MSLETGRISKSMLIEAAQTVALGGLIGLDSDRLDDLYDLFIQEAEWRKEHPEDARKREASFNKAFFSAVYEDQDAQRDDLELEDRDVALADIFTIFSAINIRDSIEVIAHEKRARWAAFVGVKLIDIDTHPQDYPDINLHIPGVVTVQNSFWNDIERITNPNGVQIPVSPILCAVMNAYNWRNQLEKINDEILLETYYIVYKEQRRRNWMKSPKSDPLISTLRKRYQSAIDHNDFYSARIYNISALSFSDNEEMPLIMVYQNLKTELERRGIECPRIENLHEIQKLLLQLK